MAKKIITVSAWSLPRLIFFVICCANDGKRGTLLFVSVAVKIAACGCRKCQTKHCHNGYFPCVLKLARALWREPAGSRQVSTRNINRCEQLTSCDLYRQPISRVPIVVWVEFGGRRTKSRLRQKKITSISALSRFGLGSVSLLSLLLSFVVQEEMIRCC